MELCFEFVWEPCIIMLSEFNGSISSWVKVFLKMLNLGDYSRVSCLYTVCLKATEHLNLKL